MQQTRRVSEWRVKDPLARYTIRAMLLLLAGGRFQSKNPRSGPIFTESPTDARP